MSVLEQLSNFGGSRNLTVAVVLGLWALWAAVMGIRGHWSRSRAVAVVLACLVVGWAVPSIKPFPECACCNYECEAGYFR